MQTCKALHYILKNRIRSPSTTSLTYSITSHFKSCTHMYVALLIKHKNAYIHFYCIYSWIPMYYITLSIQIYILVYIYTWNPNDPCFEWKRPSFGGFKPKNRGQTGSRYIYIYTHDIRLQLMSLHLNLVIVCIICTCPHAGPLSAALGVAGSLPLVTRRMAGRWWSISSTICCCGFCVKSYEAWKGKNKWKLELI